MVLESKKPGQYSWKLLTGTYAIWSRGNAFQHAGALAFYTLFSLAPLLLILIAIIGAVFGEQAAEGEISRQLEEIVGGPAAAAIQQAVSRSRIEQAGLLPTLLGIGFMLFGATAVFGQMQLSLNHFWGVTAKPTRSGIVVFATSRLISLGLVLIIGFLLMISFVTSAFVSALISYADEWLPVPPLLVTLTDVVLSLGIATLLFATIFKVLPDVRLAWADMWRGSFVTACLFVIGKYVISFYLTRTAPASTYGAAGSLVIVLMWVYYSALIVYFGAAMTRCSISQRGDRIIPKSTGVRTRIEILEEDDHGRMKKVNDAPL